MGRENAAKPSEIDRRCRRLQRIQPIVVLLGILCLWLGLLALIRVWSGPPESSGDQRAPVVAPAGTAGPATPGGSAGAAPATHPGATPATPASGNPGPADQPPASRWDRWHEGMVVSAREARNLLYIPVSLFFFWLSLRCYLYVRYRRRALAQWVRESGVPEPLEGQRALLDQLIALLRGREPDAEGSLIVLRGEWGAGKSYLIRRLRHELEHETGSWGSNKPPVVVSIDIWRHSSEPDLHFALLEAMLSHPLVPPRPAFFRYPLALVPVLLMRYVERIFQGGQVHFGSLKLAVTLPALIWQSLIEQTVWRVRQQEHRSVLWILDEIDRSSPAMAQSAVTLARRALNLPGSIVLLPYVEEQLRYKVFNPFAVSRPDIGSTLQAVMWNYRLEMDPNLTVREALGLRTDGTERADAAEPPEHAKELLDSVEMKQQTKQGAELAEQILAAEPLASLQRRLQRRLAYWLADARSGVRNRLTFLFEEKYLSLKLDVPPLGSREVAEMVQRFPNLEPLYSSYLLQTGLQAEADDPEQRAGIDGELRDEIARAIDSYHSELRIPLRRRPMIRHLEGDLFTQLALLTSSVATRPGRLDPATSPRYARIALVCAVLFAYRRSLEQVRARA